MSEGAETPPEQIIHVVPDTGGRDFAKDIYTVMGEVTFVHNGMTFAVFAFDNKTCHFFCLPMGSEDLKQRIIISIPELEKVLGRTLRIISDENAASHGDRYVFYIQAAGLFALGVAFLIAEGLGCGLKRADQNNWQKPEPKKPIDAKNRDW